VAFCSASLLADRDHPYQRSSHYGLRKNNFIGRKELEMGAAFGGMAFGWRRDEILYLPIQKKNRLQI
jgi:hypothetical protein